MKVQIGIRIETRFGKHTEDFAVENILHPRLPIEEFLRTAVETDLH